MLNIDVAFKLEKTNIQTNGRQLKRKYYEILKVTPREFIHQLLESTDLASDMKRQLKPLSDSNQLLEYRYRVTYNLMLLTLSDQKYDPSQEHAPFLGLHKLGFFSQQFRKKSIENRAKISQHISS